jgi:hypothetical protein
MSASEAFLAGVGVDFLVALLAGAAGVALVAGAGVVAGDWAQLMETQNASIRHASADHLVREAILFTVFS